MFKKVLKYAGLAVLAIVLVGGSYIGWQLYQQRPRPPVPDDLLILAEAKQILSDESKWNRQDDRNCKETDTTYSLFCALKKASIDVTGSYVHRRASLEAVRESIEEVAGRDFDHRLRDFNNLETTRLEDVWRVIDLASDKVEAALAGAKP
jgi:hypothetical protein